MKDKQRNQFLLAALKALHQSERVLAFHHLGLGRAHAWDFQAYITAVLDLCRKQRADIGGIRYLQEIQSIFGEVNRDPAPERLLSGLRTCAEYEKWLASAFPQPWAHMRQESSEKTQKQALN